MSIVSEYVTNVQMSKKESKNVQSESMTEVASLSDAPNTPKADGH